MGDGKHLEWCSSSRTLLGLCDCTFVCPRCKRVSHNRNDAREGYCGACHARTARPLYYAGLPPQSQWEVDKRLGLLDERNERGELYETRYQLACPKCEAPLANRRDLNGHRCPKDAVPLVIGVDPARPGAEERVVHLWLVDELTDEGPRLEAVPPLPDRLPELGVLRQLAEKIGADPDAEGEIRFLAEGTIFVLDRLEETDATVLALRAQIRRERLH